MTLKIKIKIILTKLYFKQFYITKQLELQGSFVNKGSGSRSGISSGSGWPKKTGSELLRIRNTD